MRLGQIREGFSEEEMTQLIPNSGAVQASRTPCAEAWGGRELAAAAAELMRPAWLECYETIITPLCPHSEAPAPSKGVWRWGKAPPWSRTDMSSGFTQLH